MLQFSRVMIPVAVVGALALIVAGYMNRHLIFPFSWEIAEGEEAPSSEKLLSCWIDWDCTAILRSPTAMGCDPSTLPISKKYYQLVMKNRERFGLPSLSIVPKGMCGISADYRVGTVCIQGRCTNMCKQFSGQESYSCHYQEWPARP